MSAQRAPRTADQRVYDATRAARIGGAGMLANASPLRPPPRSEREEPASGVDGSHLGTGAESLQIGTDADASGDYSVALGPDSYTDPAGTDGVAIGRFSSVHDLSGVAVGRAASAQAVNGAALGQGAGAIAEASTAVGATAGALGARSTALGYQAYINRDDACLVSADELEVKSWLGEPTSLILTSPDGSRWRVSVSDLGVLSVTDAVTGTGGGGGSSDPPGAALVAFDARQPGEEGATLPDDGDPIGSTWVNHGTSGADASLTAGAGVWEAAGLAGGPCLYFDGSSYFTASVTVGLPATLYVVMSHPDNDPGAAVKIGSDANGFAYGFGSGTMDSAGVVLIGLNEGVSWHASSFDPGTDGFVMAARVPGAVRVTQGATEDSTVVTTGVSFNAPSAQLRLGGYGSRLLKCRIGLVLIYEADHDASQRAEVVDWIKGTWAV